MNQLFSVCALISFLQLIAAPSYAVSFKSLSNWAFGYQEHVCYNEYPFKPNGSLNLVNHTNGSIVIKAWNRSVLVLKTVMSVKQKQEKPNISILVNEQMAQIKTTDSIESSIKVDYELMVPENSSITIATEGSVKIKGVQSRLSIKACGTVEAHHVSGSAFIETDESCSMIVSKISPSTHLSINAAHAISLTLPKGLNAHLITHTDRGSISCEHPVTFASFSMKLNNNTWQQLRRHIDGFLTTKTFKNNFLENAFSENILLELTSAHGNIEIL